MAKMSTFQQNILIKKELARLELQHQNDLISQDYRRAFSIQQSLDIARITLHEDFGFGPDRCNKFAEKFKENLVYFCKLVTDEYADEIRLDPKHYKEDDMEDLTYSITQLDKYVARSGDSRDFKQRYDHDKIDITPHEKEEKDHESVSGTAGN